MARPLRDRIVFELNSVRRELLEAVSPIPESELDYAPAAGMKSYRAQLVEIGAMEAESSIFLNEGRVPTWEEAEACVAGGSKAEILASLGEIRKSTLGFLSNADDAALLRTVRVPEGWADYFGTSDLEIEEQMRWIVRHEYYHLGQIVIYRWIQGHNPYAIA